MKKASVSLMLALALSLGGCRCARSASNASERTVTSAIDARSRSLVQLRDTLAERQTIRIEYFAPTAPESLGWGHQEGSVPPPSAIVGGTVTTVAGGREPSVKSIEIVTERNSSGSMAALNDSSNVSQDSTTETLQQEEASEARQDNGTWATIAVVAAVALLLYFTLKEALS